MGLEKCQGVKNQLEDFGEIQGLYRLQQILLHSRLTRAKDIPCTIDSAFKGSEVRIFRCPATVMGLRQNTGKYRPLFRSTEREGV